jgi:hypothetical protein
VAAESLTARLRPQTVARTALRIRCSSGFHVPPLYYLVEPKRAAVCFDELSASRLDVISYR